MTQAVALERKTRHKSRTATPFDQSLYEHRLEEKSKELELRIDKRRSELLREYRRLKGFGGPYLLRKVSGDVSEVRNFFVPAVAEVCRDAQRSTGNEITSEFLRNGLVPRILLAIYDGQSRIQEYYEKFLLIADDGEQHLPAVLNHLSQEISALVENVKNQFTVKSSKLAQSESQAATRGSRPEIAIRSKSNLTIREEKVWQVIQRGSKGAQYCRELHSAGVRPRKSWIDRGCPGTYLAAANDPVWLQRIQDEKSKVAHKAELANR